MELAFGGRRNFDIDDLHHFRSTRCVKDYGLDHLISPFLRVAMLRSLPEMTRV
jgi:hypothetical protein